VQVCVCVLCVCSRMRTCLMCAMCVFTYVHMFDCRDKACKEELHNPPIKETPSALNFASCKFRIIPFGKAYFFGLSTSFWPMMGAAVLGGTHFI